MSQDQGFVADPLHIEAVAWMWNQLDRADGEEFTKGFLQRVENLRAMAVDTHPHRKHEYREMVHAMKAGVEDMLVWVHSWQASVKLAGDPTWQKDVEATKLGEGAEEPMSAEELRRLLGV